VPDAPPSCPNPVDKIIELGRSLRVSGTPTLFFANGERAGGGKRIGAPRPDGEDAVVWDVVIIARRVELQSRLRWRAGAGILGRQ